MMHKPYVIFTACAAAFLVVFGVIAVLFLPSYTPTPVIVDQQGKEDSDNTAPTSTADAPDVTTPATTTSTSPTATTTPPTEAPKQPTSTPSRPAEPPKPPVVPVPNISVINVQEDTAVCGRALITGYMLGDVDKIASVNVSMPLGDEGPTNLPVTYEIGDTNFFRVDSPLEAGSYNYTVTIKTTTGHTLTVRTGRVLVSACPAEQPEQPPAQASPVISKLEYQSANANATQLPRRYTLTVVASDANNDIKTYTWTASCGYFFPDNQKIGNFFAGKKTSMEWRYDAANACPNASISVTAEDSVGLRATKKVTIP